MSFAVLRLNSRRWASHSRVRSDKISQTLFPPLQLYRRILRAHRQLPELQRSLGDKYVTSEFRLHRDIDNPLHIVGFLASWQDYLKLINNGTWQTGSLSKETFEKMSPEQVVQLYELMKESEHVRDGEKDSTKYTVDDSNDSKQ
ncbi:succinate dehydrogenase assembly factor 3, mitochondrial [Monosporozyma servazzii]